MRKIGIFIVVLFLFVAAVSADLRITQPKDKTITLKQVLNLEISGKNLGELSINNQLVGLGLNDSFACALFLRDGKNYVKVSGSKGDTKALRILKLKTFPDIEELYNGKKFWGKSIVVSMATLGYIEGYPDRYFYPTNAIARGEFASWLARVKKMPLPDLSKDVFYDVPKEHWRAKHIKAVLEAGYMTGISADNFGLDDFLLRREAAKIAVLAEGFPLHEFQPVFVDVAADSQYAQYIYTAFANGLVEGVSRKIKAYDPDRELRRVEAAALLSRFKQVKQEMVRLYNFNQGYNEENFCRVNIAPGILSFAVKPKEIEVGKKSVIRFNLELSPRGNFFPVSKVLIDLSPLGGLPDVELYDDGTNGDKVKGDSIYSLNVSLTPEKKGQNIINATVVDELGWESQATTSLRIVK
ncbi:hypothetical protein A2462_06995 [candidate division WOR-1 bacterium RIFOXYC2_FULL_41_25]|uniref:SLH domain-containing protein n=1 Tax=candidate division WOR-1 bacterium RIFOXYC2_FULL_41_25 TaxID=1802586 RepID=A0A1F4TRR8_UNCSA|nr:MAG: hypothetical protein A2462_06995 [candidate division WOR-1 bacterium RIFOXYC2_FULL_41_25]